MGYLTHVTFYNDAMGAFKIASEEESGSIAKKFCRDLYNSCFAHKKTNISILNYANYITVHPTRHADTTSLFLHDGNTLFDMTPYFFDFSDQLNIGNIEYLKQNIKLCKRIIKDCEKMIKTQEQKNEVISCNNTKES